MKKLITRCCLLLICTTCSSFAAADLQAQRQTHPTMINTADTLDSALAQHTAEMLTAFHQEIRIDIAIQVQQELRKIADDQHVKILVMARTPLVNNGLTFTSSHRL